MSFELKAGEFKFQDIVDFFKKILAAIFSFIEEDQAWEDAPAEDATV